MVFSNTINAFKRISIFAYKKIVHLFSGLGIGKLSIVIWIDNFIIRLLKPNYVYINGNKMYLDSEDSLRLSYGDYEPFETQLIRKEVKSGFVVLDIGANIGYYTLMLSKLVGQEGKVYAFEPDPQNFALLRKNIDVNGCKNVIIEQKAVSSENGRIRLYLCKHNRGDHRIYNFKNSRKFINIDAVRLDDYFKGYTGSINFIKMDTQGAEGLAIQGMDGLLSKNKSIKIATEFWPGEMRRSGISTEDFLMRLNKSGFRLFNINEQRGNIESISSDELLSKYSAKEDYCTNLFCIKNAT